MGIRTLETRTVEFNGAPREYHVVDRNVGCDAPQWFVSLGDKMPDKTPFISDEVPEEYMTPMILHELIEAESPKKEGRCLNALLAELETIPEAKRKDYVDFRTKVFESLLAYFRRSEPNNELIEEATKSLEYLKTR